MTQTLNDEIQIIEKLGYLKQDIKIPDYILDNLKSGLILRPYQMQALRRFFYYLNDYPKDKPLPIHLLYHMATDSGKTMIMASLILELYNRGYRNFIFFVNSSNIIQKTKDNFLNPLSNKYLFADSLKFNDKMIDIQQVDNFDGINNDNINIHFTTIQGLHTRIHNPHENALTLEDFADKKIVLISDEAHHINSDTKSNKTKGELDNSISWESTVKEIFNQNIDNVLLEFTATIDLDNQAIAEKYSDKIIFDYDLKSFRLDGYSKEVNVLEVDHKDALQRAFGAVLLSQYRRKIAQKNRLNIKPVILLKSKQIAESQKFKEIFHAFIDNLSIETIIDAKNTIGNYAPFDKVFAFLESEKIDFNNFIIELKNDFDRNKSLDINDTSELINNQILVNSLEDKNNEIRVIFAVDKLNEGWDVLNLFDIVRLYDTRDGGKTTTQEAQLIGRGARYCPFVFKTDDADNTAPDMRKFDSDINNNLRILEELHYHSPHIPKYISEIKLALRKTGILDDTRVNRDFIVKDTFKQTDFWKNGYIFLNERLKIDRTAFKTFADYNLPEKFTYEIGTGNIASENLITGQRTQNIKQDISYATYPLNDFGYSIIRNMIDSLDFYHFDSLKHYFHNLNSVQYFIELQDFLKRIVIELAGNKENIILETLTITQKSDIIRKVLTTIEQDIKNKTFDYAGTKDFKPHLLKDYIKDKVLTFAQSNETSDAEYGLPMAQSRNDYRQIDLMKCDWYVFNDCFGTSEEKHFLKYIYTKQDKLKALYDEFYLIRNESFFKIYQFDDGKAFAPDFVLFLKKKDTSEKVTYQIFIEPKGSHLLEHDKWKQEFLNKISLEMLMQTHKYHIYGLPFYTENRQQEFDKACKQIVGI